MKQYILLLIFLFTIKFYPQVSDFNHINFTVADNTAKLLKGESIKNLPLLTYKLTNKLNTDVEKFRAIYFWICNNISNDHNSFLIISKKRKKYKNSPKSYKKWHNKYKKKVFKKLLEQQKTICTGYAYLLQQMAFISGLECKMIDGYGRNTNSNVENLGIPNHTWNAIKLNNKWYLCDATWASGYADENFKFLNDYNDGFFLTSPLLFAKNHHPIDKKWLLNIKQTSDQFTSAPLIYNSAYKYKITPILPENLYTKATKNKSLQFKFKTIKPVNTNKISLIYYDASNTEKKLKLRNVRIKNDSLKFEALFQKKGSYDIHLKINNEILVSYSVYVE
ncbi:transglutaminase domain-containing protein [Tenacibaculum sp. ZS6-P6]|uniref:transglutaminase domain-containing protein n=1 Tax=Tenacibaculum sp. ZS6-P6 TaxID=3447503 RepID=UPI003F99D2A3